MKATRDDCTCPIDIVDLPIDPWCPVHANPYDLAADYGEVADQRPDDDPAPVASCNGRDCGGYPHE